MNKNRGFTLIEILVALFIFAIIAVILAFALENIFNAKKSIRKQGTEINKLQMGLLLPQRDLSQMVYMQKNRLYQSTRDGTMDFKGTVQSVTFVTDSYNNPLGFEKRSNLQRVRYGLDNGHFARTLWQALYPSKKDTGVTHDFFKVEKFKIEYISPKNLTYKQWPPVNFPSAGPPKAIVITMDLPKWGLIQQVYNVRNNAIQLS